MQIVKPVVRRSCPPVEVMGVTFDGGLPTMVVFVTPSRAKLRSFYGLCVALNVGWEELDENGAFVCSGGFDNLLGLTDRTHIVKDWWWDHEARVMSCSGSGERPKRAKTPRFTPTSKEGAEVVGEMAAADRRHA